MTKTALPLLLKTDHFDKFCTLDALQNVEDDYEIRRGVSRAKGFPADARLDMSKRYKKQVAIADGLGAPGNMHVVSQRFKDLVAERKAKGVEFLKVTINDHKGRPIKETYYILNPTEIVDCIDKAASKLDWNVIDPELISGVHKLALRTETIPAGLLLFRPKHLWHRVMIRRDFAQELQTAGFTGFRFGEPLEHIGS